MLPKQPVMVRSAQRARVGPRTGSDAGESAGSKVGE